MSKAVFCLASNDDQANRIVDRLLASGFSNADISVLHPDKNALHGKERTDLTHDADLAHEKSERWESTAGQKKKSGSLSTEAHTKAPEGGVIGATTGGVLGGSLGLLAGIGALAIPGLGPFIAAGPLMAALAGTGLGGSLGGLLGAIAGYQIPEYEAKKYEAGLKQGNILISVHTDDSKEIEKASALMKKEGAKDISSSSETAKSK